MEPAGQVKRPLGQTYQITLRLLRDGKSLEEIAAAREIVVGTVESHLVELVARGEDIAPFDIETYLPPETEALLRELFGQHGIDALSPVVDASAGAASYGQAKLVRALLATE